MTINDFEDLPAVAFYIDKLILESKLDRNKSKAKEAKILAKEYEEHCKKGGNKTKQFSI